MNDPFGIEARLRGDAAGEHAAQGYCAACRTYYLNHQPEHAACAARLDVNQRFHAEVGLLIDMLPREMSVSAMNQAMVVLGQWALIHKREEDGALQQASGQREGEERHFEELSVDPDDYPLL